MATTRAAMERHVKRNSMKAGVNVEGQVTEVAAPMAPLVFALPKGRLLEESVRVLAKAGVDAGVVLGDSRKLLFDLPGGMRALLVKPSDVQVYVAGGACHVGIAGLDQLVESPHDVYEMADLGIGRCKMALAAPMDALPRFDGRRPVRVGTLFPTIARRYFAGRGIPVEVVTLNGSVELAPLSGLADCIVDLVQSGETLRQNRLVVMEEIMKISARLVVNRAALKLRGGEIQAMLARLA